MSRGSLVDVPVGTWLCDAAFPPAGWWEDFPGCGRYYSIPTSNPKNLTNAEIEQAIANDAGFMLFVEQSETTPTTGSRDANIRLADQGTAMALDHGAPPGTPLMFAVDTEARPYMDNVRANFVLYRERVPAEFPLWAYIGSDGIDQLIEDGTIDGGHIPAALSWSSTSRPVDNVEVFRHPQGFNYYLTPAASMLQYPSQSYRGGRIDRNRAIGRRPVPVWYPGRSLEPQEDEDMLPEQAQQLANCEQFIGEIYKVLTVPIADIPADAGMQWNLALLLDHVVYKDHLVNRIADAVAAKLPAGQTLDLAAEGSQQAIIRAVDRLLSDETLVFKRA